MVDPRNRIMKRKISKQLKTDKKGEQFRLTPLRTMVVVKSNGDTIQGELKLSWTKAKRLVEQLNQALAIHESFLAEQEIKVDGKVYKPAKWGNYDENKSEVDNLIPQECLKQSIELMCRDIALPIFPKKSEN